MATQIGAVPEVTGRIASALYARIASGDVLRAEVIYPRPQPLGMPSIERLSILPLDMATFRLTEGAQSPLTNLPWDVLLEQLTEEYVYARLCSAAMHSFVAENEARMAAMAAAREHIGETLAGLVLREHQARQEEVTAEIVELSAVVLAQQGSL
jgi:F-type H+-transporting ATPase subunit gamma